MSDVPYIALANSSDIINGYDDGTFRMDRSATRAEATVMLKRYLDAKNKKPVLNELLAKFKGELDVQKFSKTQLESLPWWFGVCKSRCFNLSNGA
ncbi:hypothetical protein ASL11_34165 [Paenibacillus sp. Soil750]|nr:hypothetical protein ASL11_34165 [Paenibacillus sp. Soil750]